VTDHRELTDESATDVSFADPDEAVRERIRDLGLSEAARDIDETIRASKVPDSNVDDTVEQRVADLVDEGELGAFDQTDDGDDSAADRESADPDAAPKSEQPATDDADDATDGQVTMGDYT
jgi:hypothetical protein